MSSTANDQPKFYALFDCQTGCYMHTGYNSTSLKELTNDYISYKSIDTPVKRLKEQINKYGILSILSSDDFVLEIKKEPFEDID